MSVHFQRMLIAKKVCSYSNCQKRKIAAIVPVGDDTIWGYNNVLKPCPACNRESCGAIHAEQSVIMQLLYLRLQQECTTMYVWAEPPCKQCLNFIRRHSAISVVYCLSPESYLTEYPIIARRTEEIKERRQYAQSLGIAIIELDREEILQYELLGHSQTHV